MTAHITYARPRVRGPKLLLTAAIALVLAIGTLTMAGPTANAASAPALGAAGNFAVLSAAPEGGGAVTCTDSTIIGDVGSSGVRPSVTRTSCKIDGAVIAPVSEQVVAAFNDAYDALADVDCEFPLPGDLAGVTLTVPGVYCSDAAVTTTDGTLTLSGPADGIWIFKIGTLGTGALTGTNFDVVMTGDANPCNVTWWVAEGATMTDSTFIGTILAGAGITVTRGTFDGSALARAAVTITGATLTGCVDGSLSTGKAKCNQGVGNGDEGCDPGKSNQGDDDRSNDEPLLDGTPGGTPGDPGRAGGNGK